jgi:uncharacterized protein YjiS (DUF1127 family)
MATAAHHPLTNSQAFLAHGLAERFGDIVHLWRSRIKERHTVAAFDHRELQDLGLSRWEVERELAKPFWRG